MSDLQAGRNDAPCWLCDPRGTAMVAHALSLYACIYPEMVLPTLLSLGKQKENQAPEMNDREQTFSNQQPDLAEALKARVRIARFSAFSARVTACIAALASSPIVFPIAIFRALRAYANLHSSACCAAKLQAGSC
jgi:hypothetical protein